MVKFNKVQLMTYPDSIGGNLKTLYEGLEKYLTKAISGVHILPPYPSSGDRGFAPLTHMEIDPRFGTWEDIRRISDKYDLELDLILGHVSTESKYFKHYLENNGSSEYADMFMQVRKVFPDGMKVEQMERLIFNSSIPPFIVYKFKNGKTVAHFKTFLPFQADLDVRSPLTRKILTEFVEKLAKNGVKIIRLDAVELSVKDAEEGFYMVSETYEVIKWAVDLAAKNGIQALSEIHAPNETRKKVLQTGSILYDFNLPELIFYALFSKDTSYLKNWIKQRPEGNWINVLTNHDGIRLGVDEPILTEEELKFTRETIMTNAGKSTQRASGAVLSNIVEDIINATLIEALFRDQAQWLVAHAIQLFFPGTPQIYYNDLLGQKNDEELLNETGEGRSLVRHNHPQFELEHKFNQPFVKRLIIMMEIRNNHPAFEGEVKIEESAKHILKLRWENGVEKVHVTINTLRSRVDIVYFDHDSGDFKELEF